jgi:hypothetical protein
MEVTNQTTCVPSPANINVTSQNGHMMGVKLVYGNIEELVLWCLGYDGDVIEIW